jgi:hypothetical protein
VVVNGLDALGVTELLAELDWLVPFELLPVTVNVYAVPFVSPLIAIGDEEPLAVTPPGDDVT